MDYVFTEEDAKKVILSLTAYDFLDAVQNDHPQHPEEIKSRYDYNKYVFKYESLFSVIPLEIKVPTWQGG